MAIKASSYRLNIWCKKHPKYRGIRPSKCNSCFIIFSLARNNTDGFILHRLLSTEEVMEALKDLTVRQENAPTAIRLTRNAKPRKQSRETHYADCPAYGRQPGEITGCTCSGLARE